MRGAPNKGEGRACVSKKGDDGGIWGLGEMVSVACSAGIDSLWEP